MWPRLAAIPAGKGKHSQSTCSRNAVVHGRNLSDWFHFLFESTPLEFKLPPRRFRSRKFGSQRRPTWLPRFCAPVDVTIEADKKDTIKKAE